MNFLCATRPNDFQPAPQTRTKINLRAWHENAVKRLNRSDTPSLEALLLLAEVLEKPREWVISHFDDDLDKDQSTRLESFLNRLLDGEPLAYITGRKAFYGLDFSVTPAVLIPRPETELLVEEAIQWLSVNPSKRSVADVGTGSGVIAVVLTDAIADLRVTAIDISPAALEIAKRNCERYHHADQVTFRQNDLLAGITDKFDLIAANLPYIPISTLDHLDGLRYEPRLALAGGEDGTKFIRPLLEQSVHLLNPGGMILLEIEATISEIVHKQARDAFPNARINVLFDFANLPRIVKILK